MSLSQFPVLAGKGWDIKKTPLTSTRILQAASGVEYRAQNWSTPLWKFSIPLNFLRQYGSYTEYANIVGFVLSQAGSFQNFLYDDPYDDSVTNQTIGTGDGTTTNFGLVRTLGGYTMPVNYSNVVSAVYLNNLLQVSGYSITQQGAYGPDTISFASPPAPGVTVSATFTFYFVCRFLSDAPEFNNFTYGRWENSAIEFQSVK